MQTPTRLLACFTLAFALALASCQSEGTEPDYRPKNPPPAPQHTPRAIEQGGHIGLPMSNEVSAEQAEQFERDAKAADEDTDAAEEVGATPDETEPAGP